MQRKWRHFAASGLITLATCVNTVARCSAENLFSPPARFSRAGRCAGTLLPAIAPTPRTVALRAGPPPQNVAAMPVSVRIVFHCPPGAVLEVASSQACCASISLQRAARAPPSSLPV